MSTAADTTRAGDIDFLFKALSYVALPLTINVTDLAAAEGAKVPTISKRISRLAAKYDLKITTTTKAIDPDAPVTPRKGKGTPGKTATPRKRKTPAKGKKGSSDEDGEEDEVNGVKSDQQGQSKGKKVKTAEAEDVDAGANVEEEVAEA